MASKHRTRLVIQIPCFNEEENLPHTLTLLPKKVSGIDEIIVVVVNDGSTDRTVHVAREAGVRAIVDLGTNRGLAEAFMAGLEEAMRQGADYVVNLDADNQYDARDIPLLLAPLQQGAADLVVGERPIDTIEHFSLVKKKLQAFGSRVVSQIAGVDVKDVTSGFRALNRSAMLGLFIFNKYTYTHESLLMAREANLRVVGVPIRVNNEPTRESRLMKSTLQYILKSSHIIIRAYVIYNPFPLYMWLSSLLGLTGSILLLRFFYFYFTGQGAGWIQSVVISVFLMLLGFLTFLMGLLSDSLSINRRLSMKLLKDFRENLYGLKGVRQTSPGRMKKPKGK